MRITISFNSDQEVMLPIHYNHIVQAFIYNNISDKDYRSFLHTTGYYHEDKQFKLFTFSRLRGKFRLHKEEGKISFSPPVTLVISSPLEPLITDLAETLIKSERIYLGRNVVTISGINVHRELNFGEKIQIKMLSPIVAHTTTFDNGKKTTNYFSPWDDEFDQLINMNLSKKYQIIYDQEPKGKLFVIPGGTQKDRMMSIINYKGFYIKGYSGLYWLVGDPDLMKVAYDCGLGSKNSQGFGCWELI